MRLRSTPVRLTALVVSAALLPALVGCTGNPVENAVEQATGGNVQLGGDIVPEGFPAEVPLYDGTVQYGVAIGDDAGRAFNVTIAVPDGSAAQAIEDQLVGAGFGRLGGTQVAAAGATVYDGANYSVAVLLTDNGDSGWSANYTVTPKRPTGQ
jgi:hypothetical protein